MSIRPQYMQIPTYRDVEAAAKRLQGHVRPTPLVRSPVIDLMVGKSVWFKPECSQKVGAFKYRGGYNRLSAMTPEERKRGVVAFSSGNHAQGVSRAAKELGISATIVMPSDAPKIKVAGVKNDGAKIVLYDRLTGNREDIAAEIAERENRIVVPSYDDPYIIAGQGTIGLEVAAECQTKGVSLDALITPMGGGGLCAGTSLSMQERSPNTRIFGAEPTAYNDHQVSIRAGKQIALSETPATLCDAIMTPCPGNLTFPINKNSVEDVFTANDRDCLMAMAIVKRELGLTVEPGGAIALACVLRGAFHDRKDIRTICVILSGGNVDPDVMAQADALLG